MASNKITIGLALGGGAARGLAHIGILHVLEQAGITIDYLAGTSAGALIAVLYASGVRCERLAELVRALKWPDMFGPCLPLHGLFSSEPLHKLLRTHCRATRFDELRIPVAVVACDFESGHARAFTDGDLFPAVLASCSIPLLCEPVRCDGRYYIDGGVAAEIPVDAVHAMGADIAVACDVHHRAARLQRPGNLLATLMHMGRLISQNNAEDAKQRAELSINVDARGIRLSDLGKADEIIRRGRRAAEAILPELLRLSTTNR